MPQNIKKILKDYKEEEGILSKNHQHKFKQLLLQELHPQKNKYKKYQWFSMAASIVLLIGLGITLYPKEKKQHPTIEKEISLGSISPEFKTIESYYVNSINLEISQLDLTDENQEIIDGYLIKIAELTKEYQLLTQELNTKGVNNDTIDALIRNLQLRLQLLQRLKKQLKELQNLNLIQNETQII